MADGQSSPQGPGLSWDGILRVEAHIATGDAIAVRHLDVRERMSTLFAVRLKAVSKNPDIDFEATIGQPMTVIAHGAEARTWVGVCSDLRQVRVDDEGLSTYELTLVPSLWLATQRRNHRMFQHLSELDIALQLLGEWGISPTLKLTGQYKKRKYRLQYGETDHAFICRMLEEAGISHYFDNLGASGLVLDDGPQSNTARMPIEFRDVVGEGKFEHVTQVQVGRRLVSGKYTVRDHDYRRPATFDLVSSAAAGRPVEEKLELFNYEPGSFLYESKAGDNTPAADDQGKYRADEPEGESLAQRRLEAQRTAAHEISFGTNCIDLAPASVVTFLDHPKSECGPTRRLLVVETHITADQPGVYVHKCTAVSAEPRYRPPVVTPRPRAQGVESATVVGPAGEEIHVDEFGRVRVQFHWDREGQMNEHSSCWIHVNQPWGGTGFGGTNLPRIGQEVIVDFLNADPDRPVVTGRVYTNLTKTPYALPANKTQSGWKSNSSPNCGGYNELMFEDKAGVELVRFQAQKDHNELVKNDRSSTIGNDRTTSIGNDESQSIGNCLSELVGMNRSRGVGNDESVQIGRNQSTTVGEKIQIVCGKSSFSMDKDGNISLSGVNITISGSTHVQVSSELIDLN